MNEQLKCSLRVGQTLFFLFALFITEKLLSKFNEEEHFKRRYFLWASMNFYVIYFYFGLEKSHSTMQLGCNGMPVSC